MKRVLLASLTSVVVIAAACRRAAPVVSPPPQQAVDSVTLETRIAALDAEMGRLRGRLESLQAQNDSLRRNASRMESEIKDREEQIKAIRLELQKLKEIDLKPRPRPTP